VREVELMIEMINYRARQKSEKKPTILRYEHRVFLDKGMKKYDALLKELAKM
jgi:hypothetical protein